MGSDLRRSKRNQVNINREGFDPLSHHQPLYMKYLKLLPLLPLTACNKTGDLIFPTPKEFFLATAVAVFILWLTYEFRRAPLMPKNYDSK